MCGEMLFAGVNIYSQADFWSAMADIWVVKEENYLGFGRGEDL